MAFSRDNLKNKFLTGAKPAQQDFDDLIDSNINLADDGITPLPSAPGIRLSPKRKDSSSKAYTIEFGGGGIEALTLLNFNDAKAPKVTLNKKGLSADSLDVNSLISMPARLGSLVQSGINTAAYSATTNINPQPIDGDRKWHEILRKEKSSGIYEVTAQLKGERSSVLYAMAFCSESLKTPSKYQNDFQIFLNAIGNSVKKLFGISSTKISKTRVCSGRLGGKIRIKWVENDDSYSLQVHAKSGKIYCAVTQLWDNIFTNDQNQ